MVSIGVTSHLCRREMAMSERHYLSSLWNGILDLSHSNPGYLDITVTENCQQAMTAEERVKYDIFCVKAWGHAQELIEHGDPNRSQSLAALQWLIAFHLTWLEDNSAHFLSDSFWSFIEEKKLSSALVLRHCAMPTLPDGEINWDEMSNDYFEYVLSPLHPDMLAGPEPRNRLVERVEQHVEEDRREIVVADFGAESGRCSRTSSESRPLRPCTGSSSPSLPSALRSRPLIELMFPSHPSTAT
jgi:hypothetical protein